MVYIRAPFPLSNISAPRVTSTKANNTTYGTIRYRTKMEYYYTKTKTKTEGKKRKRMRRIFNIKQKLIIKYYVSII